MKTVIETTLPREVWIIGDRLQQSLRPDRIYLFGSHARGEAGPDSDLDFLVVVPASEHSRYHRAVAARRLLRDLHYPKEIIVLTRQEWERELRVPSSLSSTVQREGILLTHAHAGVS